MRSVELMLLASVLLAFLNGAALQAQTFAPIPALSFTKQFGQPNPLPQVLHIASPGTNFNFSATVSTSSGGNWLAVTGLGCGGGNCGTTPVPVRVVINSATTLAPGTYTGQIAFTAGTVSMAVPVTLTVVASGASYIDGAPGALNYSMKTAGMNPPAQTIQVRNGNAGALSWSGQASTSDGGNWLSVSALSGTTPSLVSVSVQKANLPGGGAVAGTYIGQVLLQTGGSSVTVPISFIVADNVLSQVHGLNFTKVYAGADPLPQVITMASTAASINFSASVATSRGGDWLSVSGLGCGGSYCGSTTGVVTVSVNPDVTLAAGTYTAEIVVASSTMAITVPVSLTIAPASDAFFDNLPGQLSFSMKVNGTAPPDQTVNIRNAGSSLLDWTASATTADGGDWLGISQAGGTAPSLTTIRINPSNLPNSALIAGTFVGQLVFRSAASTVTIPVSVVVGNNILSQVNGINFTKLYAGANPLPQVLTIAGTGSAINFSASVSTARGGSWLSITGLGCGGSNCGSTPQVVTAVVNASPTLSPGTYTGQIVFTSGAMAITVPVTLTVVAPSADPFFDNLPGQMSFSFQTGAAAPPAQALEIRNGGPGTLNWTLESSTADGGNWLSTSIQSGTAPSLVNIAVLKQNLPGSGLIAGTFTGQLVFRSASGTVTIPVTVVIAANVLAQINGISFTKPYGGANPLPQVLTLTSTGDSINFSATVSTGTGGDWLSVSGLGCGGSNCGSSPKVVVVSVNPAATLAAGTYTAQIVFSAGSMAITVPVTLTVGALQPFFDNLPGHLSFSTVTGGPNWPAQSFEVRNAGLGTLNWTVTATTSDGGNWLTTSAQTGTAPSNVLARIVNTALPGGGLVPGIFTGELVFRMAGGSSSVTVPVSVHVAANIFSQFGGVTFTKLVSGSNPLSQSMTVASTGAAISFNAIPSSGNGGQWLSVSGLGCGGSYCGTTPQAVTVSVNAASLPAGHYTGQIVFNAGSIAQTVPVSLVVGTSSSPSAPVTGALSPASGSGTAQTFTATFSDDNGVADLTDAYFLINSALNGNASCFVRYNRLSNQLSVINDAGNAWTGAVSPGAAQAAANSQCTLSGAGSAATPSGNTLTLSVALTFSAAFAGPKAVYLIANDAGNLSSGWQQKGTWTVNVPGSTPPAALSVSPTAGSGSTQMFTAVFSDPNGSADLSDAYMLINSTLNGNSACFVRYNRAANQFSVLNDAGNTWTGAVTPGSPLAVSNSQCTLMGAGAVAQSVGTTLTVSVPLAFASSFTGAKNVYMLANDTGNLSSGWQQRGTWSVLIPASAPPSAVQISPISGAGVSQTFTVLFSDPNGASDLADVYMLFNTSLNGTGACFVRYNRAANQFSVINDAGNNWTGVVPPGSSQVASNGQCTVSGAGATVSTAGVSLSVSVPITFTSAFTGPKSVYILANDAGNLSSGWLAAGTWTVSVPPPAPPLVLSVTPASGTGSSQTFTAAFSDPNGFANMTDLYLLMNSSLNGVGACFVRYNRAANQFSVINDAGNAWTGTVSPGSGQVASNSQCTLLGTGASAAGSGSTLTITAPITFVGTFAGPKVLYAIANDADGLSSGWQPGGNWNVVAPPPAAPAVVSVNPPVGSGSSQTFTATYLDPNGAADLSEVFMLINSTLNGTGGCFIRYNRAANQLSVINDAGTGWLGPVIPGSAQSASNSQCTISGTGGTATAVGATLAISVPVTFQAGFAGAKSIFLLGNDLSNQSSGWQLGGTWTVTAP